MKTNNKNIIIIAGSLVVGLLLGWLFFSGSGEAEHPHQHSADVETLWTCSMHPQIRQEEPGSCPLCGMDLIPLKTEAVSADANAVTMTEYAMKLANVQTMKVGAGQLNNEVRLNGKIVVDERSISTQSSHIPGRIEQLTVNFTGEEVRRGQVLARIYSPEMVTAQQELLQAYAIRESQPALFEASKAKLRNWRIGESQINQILETGKPLEQFPVVADVSGVVTEKLVELGDYVERGSPIYTIADLSKVWVEFDVYERMMGAIAEGSNVSFSIASQPGVEYEGKVTFVAPLLNSQTRVSTARVEVTNKNGQLKPGMFVSGIAEISETNSGAMSIPKSAVLWTGKRSVVYVKQVEGSFVLREVVLGPEIGESYIIEEGLQQGEEIVFNGTFTVDAAAQLTGKPSMMNPEGATQPEKGNSEDLRQFLEMHSNEFKMAGSYEFHKELQGLLSSYLKLKDGLVEGNPTENSTIITKFRADLIKAKGTVESEEAAAFWKERQHALIELARQMEEAEDLKVRRDHFEEFSKEMIKTVAAFGTTGQTLYVDYCPMADSDKGAYWLSEVENIRNPYFGQAMLTCGEIITAIN